MPLWTTETLAIAEAIRTGEHEVIVGLKTLDNNRPEDPRSYADHIARLNESVSGIRVVPANPQWMQVGQEAYAQLASTFAGWAAQDAGRANIAIPDATGQTLYQAIDAYAEHIRENQIRGGEITGWGRTLSESVLRLKNSTKDMPLERLDYNAVEQVKNYWARRPPSKVTRKPISLETVRGQLKALRMFLQWLHKNSQFQWRKPDSVEEAWRCDLARLRSDDEISALNEGVKTYSVEELKILYSYATDRERILILLGLNCGFARAECVSLRLEELELDIATIKRVRRKTHVRGEFALWPETVCGLRWVSGQRKGVESQSNVFVLTTEQGKPLKENRIANQWNRLLDRIEKDHPKFRRLSFKYIRKTAAQFVRDVSDGETTGVFLCQGSPVKSDELASAYSNPNFGRVSAALAQVYKQLQPLFATCPNVFSKPRKKGGANISLAVVRQIGEMHASGVSIGEIAGSLGVSRTTVYRRLAAVDQKHHEDSA